MIVLDIGRGSYFALDPATSREWTLFCDGGDGSAALVEAIAERGWLADGEQEQPSSRGLVRLLAGRGRHLLAAGCLAAARWRLGRGGFTRAYRWAQAWAGSSRRPQASLEADLRPFLAVEALVPSALGERDCLPRSLALFVYLRALGHDARHVIGVARFPFSAHAWVEVGNEALLEKRIEQKLLLGSRSPKGRTPIAVIA